MKRKRKDVYSTPLLEDSPKRPKVQAQRKFAQGSLINSPVITPIRDLECELPRTNVVPEPVELLPMKRPNTEDFLTFLCFRGTPVLPPTLNFFNTASIVDTNGQVHEIKSESSPKNGPIDISKCGTSSEKPFVAFGVRKRADPIVISRQMDRKRRHALAIQALRRKYQEQKMAKIRALTISKLSEKTTNKTLVKTNTVSKTETVTKKNTTLQKTKVVATKHVKVTTRTLKTTLRPKMKQKMCLRSFRGRFVHKELPFRNKRKNIPEKKAVRKPEPKKGVKKQDEDNKREPQDKGSVKTHEANSKAENYKKKSVRSPGPSSDTCGRITRSGVKDVTSPTVSARRKQIKKRMLLSTPKTITVKPKLRSTTLKKTILSHRKARQRELRVNSKDNSDGKESLKSPESVKPDITRKFPTTKKDTIEITPKKETKQFQKFENKKEVVKNVDSKKETIKSQESLKKDIKKNVNISKSTKSKTNTKDTSKSIDLKKEILVTKSQKIIENSERESGKKELNKSTSESSKKIVTKKLEKSLSNKKNVDEINDLEESVDDITKQSATGSKSINTNKKLVKKTTKEITTKDSVKDQSLTEVEQTIVSKEEIDEPSIKFQKLTKKKETEKRKVIQKNEEEELIQPRTSQRPSRKTKEAAAIYMEILSHKLVNDSRVDDDNVSIDSFPELPNVKRTEQRENELKAKAKEKPKVKKVVDGVIKTQTKSGKIPTKRLNHQVDIEDEKNKKTGSNKPQKKKLSVEHSDKSEPKISEIENNETETKLLNEEKEFNEDNHSKSKDTTTFINVKNAIKSSEIHNKQNSETCKPLLVMVQSVLHSKEDEDPLNLPKQTNTGATGEKKHSLGKRKSLDAEMDSDDEVLQAKIQKSKNTNTEHSKKGQKLSTNKTGESPEKTCIEDSNVLGVKSIITKSAVADSDDEVLQVIMQKSESKDSLKHIQKTTKKEEKNEETTKGEKKTDLGLKSNKRHTRHSAKNIYQFESDYSDESFHVDIKVPKKKTLTRSKTKLSKSPAPENKISAMSETVDGQFESNSSDSEESTTSDINLKTLQTKTRNKKFSKTKSTKKSTTAFSESDEEPLSKLTANSDEEPLSKLTTKSVKSGTENESKHEEKSKKENDKRDQKKTSKTPDVPKLEPKPKRECAKRPQNYLAMLSSSSEDDEGYFHGFSEKPDPKKTKIVLCHAAPSLDILGKNAGRKGKVNMSNEQIEKWLNDSAMAGSIITRENDSMLKFGIPTDTSLEIPEPIDTLKSSLLQTEKRTNDVPDEKQDKDSSQEKTPESKTAGKTLSGDRKLIFRKDKKGSAPNVNAFSPENESSVYAFGEDNEDVFSTPFRRPSRRPSSTATSRSEDESSKQDEMLKTGHFLKPTIKHEYSKFCKEDTDTSNQGESEDITFNVPQHPFKTLKTYKTETITSNTCKASTGNKKTSIKTGEKIFDNTDEMKYKIPSSPSASSSSSAKLYKKQPQKQKIKPPEPINVTYVSDFPKNTETAKIVESPVFHPTDNEFQDPLEYIERIRHKAEQFGICRIVPPSSFKPECKVSDDMRFTSYNQYVHKMLHRWGPNFKELMAIRKYLATQNIVLKHSPWIGGMEIDLPRLYQTVQSLGGLKEVIEKKKWPKVSECMKIPKSAQDRVTKLDDIYCKYLLPYDTLSPAEREKLFNEVETDWAKRESKGLAKAEWKIEEEGSEDESESDDNEAEECIVKGRNMALNAFYRIARNTMSMHFKTPEPPAQEVEQEFWRHVTQKQNHICVHSGSIDCGNWGYGFAISKNSPFARHAWNLKVLTNNSGSVLRSLGPVMGVTVPTLHVGMVFSACCWYRDPHGLPWIEYLHTGGSKVWYAIPNSTSELFHSTLKRLVPNYCRNKELWLPSDTVMVPPTVLVENNVSLCRTVQEPGQFIVVFPKAFTSSISTGYVVSESVYFAPSYWLKTARGLFDNLKNSCEPSMFSLERLLLSIVSDSRATVEVLRLIRPYVQELCDMEKSSRNKLKSFGNVEFERLPSPEAGKRRKKHQQGDDGEYECEVCRMNLYVSMFVDTHEDLTYCLEHAVPIAEKCNTETGRFKLLFTYDEKEIDELCSKVQTSIENKLQKKVPGKYHGMPTLLTK